jgi:hypothetical protein
VLIVKKLFAKKMEKWLAIDFILPTTGTGRQSLKAFPVKPAAQLQTGEWLTTRHSEFEPQVPGQGSTHF